MKEADFLTCNCDLPSIIDNIRYNYRYAKEHPDRMLLNGIICFCGEQGSGKTLSAVNYLESICKRFPLAIVCTNLDLRLDIDNVIVPYVGVESLIDINNDELGVIYLIDEIHLEFNSLESKKMDSNIFTLVSQQRKQRKHIIGTSQVFSRIAKPFREQFKYAVLCRSYFGMFFKQEIYRASSVGTEDDIKAELSPAGVRWYISNPDMFSKYDTLKVIERKRGNWI